jgi:periplasmic mercuric ion binding protein
MKTTFLTRIMAAFLVAGLVLTMTLTAQDNSKAKEVKIKASVWNWMQKNKIEKTLGDKSGVIESYVDMKEKIVTVKYDPSLIKPEKIKSTIEEMGIEVEFMKSGADKTDKSEEDSKTKEG